MEFNLRIEKIIPVLEKSIQNYHLRILNQIDIKLKKIESLEERKKFSNNTELYEIVIQTLTKEIEYDCKKMMIQNLKIN